MVDSSDQGFVLPYVLVVIAVLAIATTIAAERLQSSINILIQMQDQNRIKRQLFTAEAEAVYGLLTGINIDGAVDLNPDSPIVSEFGFITSTGEFNAGVPDNKDFNRDLWSGSGGKRISFQEHGNVIIELRDVTGLISLSTGSDTNIISALEVLGVKKNMARSLTAKLRDYSDADNQRLFRGGERADYILQDMAPPTNSPLRNYNELSHIIEWENSLKGIDIYTLKNITTLQPVSKVNKTYATPEVAKIIGLDAQERTSTDDLFDLADLAAESTNLSDLSRLSLWAKKRDGPYVKRVIEIQRTANHIEKPFRKFWVYETTVLEADLEFDLNSINEMKNVIHAESVLLP